jgi:cupin 2 domain-containing protein
MIAAGNLFSGLPGLPADAPQDAPEAAQAGEQVTALVTAAHGRIERIVSRGQATPPGVWYDQEFDEWVAVLAGAAGLLIEGEAAPRRLGPGDYVHLPAHVRHRVEWTDPAGATVWLAVHLRQG